MYTNFFGFERRPFEISPDPTFVHWTPQHREVRCNLAYGITGRKALTVLTGEAGTGKTTLLQSVLAQTRESTVDAVYLDNPKLSRDEFIEHLGYVFELTAAAGRSKSRLLIELTRQLRESYERGRTAVLVIDEAQSLPDDLLEEIRLLSNLEHGTTRLLPVLLVGQPRLADRLNEPGMTQLKQRVALRCALKPFDRAETAAYIAARMALAGGTPRVRFSPEVVDLVHIASRGIARTINVICDNALVTCFADQQHLVTPQVVRDVCRDFDFPLTLGEAEPMPTAMSPTDRRSEPGSAMFHHFARRPRLSLFSFSGR